MAAALPLAAAEADQSRPSELGIAWRLQEKALGGLAPAGRRQLAAVADTLGTDGDIATPRAVAPKAGARLVREWNGETRDVLVLEDGFRWRGKTWPSLSAIALQITGRAGRGLASSASLRAATEAQPTGTLDPPTPRL
ncbi:DUF2924 domain-containing protein [Acuticoccus sp.]|uniref:DUF2924 domain-containing protein n=1 Tax=Acuticoccus sp. TaxID=1904378 RepID=UPI003B5171C4